MTVLVVWEWLKKWGSWLVAGVSAFVALAVLFFRKTPSTTSKDEFKRQVEEETEKKALEAKQEKEVAQEEAKKEHTKAVQEVLDEQKKKQEELLSDPEAENEFLREVGRKARGEP